MYGNSLVVLNSSPSCYLNYLLPENDVAEEVDYLPGVEPNKYQGFPHIL